MVKKALFAYHYHQLYDGGGNARILLCFAMNIFASVPEDGTFFLKKTPSSNRHLNPVGSALFLYKGPPNQWQRDQLRRVLLVLYRLAFFFFFFHPHHELRKINTESFE